MSDGHTGPDRQDRGSLKYGLYLMQEVKHLIAIALNQITLTAQ